MSAHTYSEDLFEQYCHQSGFKFTRIATSHNQRTPDYEITTQAGPIICEITELKPNDADIATRRALEEYGFSGMLELAGRRILIKARDKKGQLKARCTEKTPGLIVFCQQPNLGSDYLTWDHFEAAMYGLPSQSNLYDRTPQGHDNHGLCGPHKATYVSALARLEINDAGSLKLFVYHNDYARCPIPQLALNGTNCLQFTKSPKLMNGPWGWSER